KEIQAEIGQGYFIPIQTVRFPLAVPADGQDNPNRSQVQLVEDGNRLGPAHSGHDRVRNHGHVAFSHWEDFLLFSTSDGSDPRTNGRTYSVNYPLTFSSKL